MRLGLCLSRYLADVLTRNIRRKIVSLVVCVSRFNAQYSSRWNTEYTLAREKIL